jgi:hypothetical protein
MSIAKTKFYIDKQNIIIVPINETPEVKVFCGLVRQEYLNQHFKQKKNSFTQILPNIVKNNIKRNVKFQVKNQSYKKFTKKTKTLPILPFSDNKVTILNNECKVDLGFRKLRLKITSYIEDGVYSSYSIVEREGKYFLLLDISKFQKSKYSASLIKKLKREKIASLTNGIINKDQQIKKLNLDNPRANSTLDKSTKRREERTKRANLRKQLDLYKFLEKLKREFPKSQSLAINYVEKFNSSGENQASELNNVNDFIRFKGFDDKLKFLIYHEFEGLYSTSNSVGKYKSEVYKDYLDFIFSS